MRYETLSMTSLKNKANGSIVTLKDICDLSTHIYWACYYNEQDNTYYAFEEENTEVGRIVNGKIRWEYNIFCLIVSDDVESLKISGENYYVGEEEVVTSASMGPETIIELPTITTYKAGEWVLVTYVTAAYRMAEPAMSKTEKTYNITIPLNGNIFLSLSEWNTDTNFPLTMIRGDYAKFISFSNKNISTGHLPLLRQYCSVNDCVLISQDSNKELRSITICGKTFTAENGQVVINSSTWMYNGLETICVIWHEKTNVNVSKTSIDSYQYQMDETSLTGETVDLNVKNQEEHSANCIIPNYLINNQNFAIKTYTDPVYMKEAYNGFRYNYNLAFPTSTSSSQKSSSPYWWYGIPKNWPPHVFFEDFLNQDLAYSQRIIRIGWNRYSKKLTLFKDNGTNEILDLTNADFPIYIAIRAPKDPVIDVKRGFNIYEMSNNINAIWFGNANEKVWVDIKVESNLLIYTIEKSTENFTLPYDDLSKVLNQLVYTDLPDLIKRHSNIKKAYSKTIPEWHVSDSTTKPDYPSNILNCRCNINEIYFNFPGYVDALWFEDDYYNQQNEKWFIQEDGTNSGSMFYLAIDPSSREFSVDYLSHTFMHCKYNGLFKTTFFTLGNLFNRPVNGEKLNSLAPATDNSSIIINATTIAQNEKDYGHSFEFDYIPGADYNAKMYFPTMFQALTTQVFSSDSKYRIYKLYYNRATSTTSQAWFVDSGNPINDFTPGSFWRRYKTDGYLGYWKPNIFFFPYVILNGSSQQDISNWKQEIEESTGQVRQLRRENLRNNLYSILNWVKTGQPNRVAIFASLSDKIE